jgi:Protein of unknown function (DUF2970)
LNRNNKPEKKKKAVYLQAAGAVFWSFFGVRKRKDYDSDAESLTPVQVIVSGLIGGLVFILSVWLMVRLLLDV